MGYKQLLDPGANRVWKFRTKNLEVCLTLTPEYGYPYDGDDPDGEVQGKIDDGEYVAFDSDVTVTHRQTGAELGSDSLSGSVYGCDETEQFYTMHRSSDPKQRNCSANSYKVGHYFPQMVREACEDARKVLRAIQAIRVRGEARP